MTWPRHVDGLRVSGKKPSALAWCLWWRPEKNQESTHSGEAGRRGALEERPGPHTAVGQLLGAPRSLVAGQSKGSRWAQWTFSSAAVVAQEHQDCPLGTTVPRGERQRVRRSVRHDSGFTILSETHDHCQAVRPTRKPCITMVFSLRLANDLLLTSGCLRLRSQVSPCSLAIEMRIGGPVSRQERIQHVSL